MKSSFFQVGQEGFWNDDPCEKSAQAVCEKKGYNYVPPPTPSPPVVSCAPDWVEFNKRCYYFSKDSKTFSWDAAQLSCKR